MKRLAVLLLCALLLAGAAHAEGALSEGSRDPAVAEMKMRLYDLGYYGKPQQNSIYTEATARVVGEFQAENGLEVTGIADEKTLALLHAPGALRKGAGATPSAAPAQATVASSQDTGAEQAEAAAVEAETEAALAAEPAVPLALGDYAYLRRKDGALLFNPQVVNLSAARAVAGFDLVFYARGADGRPLLLPDGGLFLTRRYDLHVAAGQTVFAGEVPVEGFPDAARLFAAVAAVNPGADGALDIPEAERRFFAWEVPQP